jgi:predicted  nucleic acid-binding Zn-ribbon protein
MIEEFPMEDDEHGEKIFELQQENNKLRGQITYLQEELSCVEDELDKVRDSYERQIESLEQQLGDALYGRE